jgi:uncharacterized RDD family membrane protein YckC
MNDDLPTGTSAAIRTRVFAFALDYLLICGYILLLAAVNTLLLRSPLRPHLDPLLATPIRRDLLAFLTLVFPVMLYFTYGESSHAQATWGKRTVGVVVVDQRGDRVSRRRALARAALKLLPWQVAHTTLFHIPGWPLATTSVPPLAQGGIGVTWLIVSAYLVSGLRDQQHRTLYDRAAGTLVVRWVAGASVRRNAHP